MNISFPRIERLPPYILSQVVELMQRARKEGKDIIDMGMGNPDLATPPPIVAKLKEAVDNPRNHRYSASRGIKGLRDAICKWYERQYEVELDPEKEAIVTIGSKEGIAHLIFATIERGDNVLVPSPTYPIHSYSVVITGGDLRSIPLLGDEKDFFQELEQATRLSWPKPKMVILSFPHNPTTKVVSREFFAKIVDFAKENKLWVVHDLAYADLCFDGYKAPSFLEVNGAKDVGVEFYTLSKSFSMPGWRVGFCLGNRHLVNALGRLKSYLDYGVFQPIQIASIIALNRCGNYIPEIARVYQRRRDVLVDGLNRMGWKVEKPKATMFVWAALPDEYKEMGSLEFSKMLLKEACVAVSPGIGFGEMGEGFVRFALVENEHRIRQALRGIRRALFKQKGAKGGKRG